MYVEVVVYGMGHACKCKQLQLAIGGLSCAITWQPVHSSNVCMCSYTGCHGSEFTDHSVAKQARAP